MKKFLTALALAAMVITAGYAEAAITCTQALATQFKGNALSGVYRSDHTYKIAFIKDSGTGTYNATTKQYSDISADEMTGTNQGPYTLSGLTYGTSGTTYWITFTNNAPTVVTFAADSGCAIIYDDSAVNTGCTATGVPDPCCTGAGTGTCQDSVIGVWSFTSVKPVASTLNINFPTADATNAVIRFASVYDWIMYMASQDEMPQMMVAGGATITLKGMATKGLFLGR
jgi:opacity protein-like surface antigen